MNHSFDTPEHQALVAEAHCLVAVIARKSSGTKLLRGVLPMLRAYADYKPRRIYAKNNTNNID